MPADGLCNYPSPGLCIGLALRKETLRRRGILAAAKVRRRGPSLDSIDDQELTHLLGRLDLALGRLGVQPARFPGAR